MYTEIWERTRAVLFDLDGVLTPTDRIHEAAWEQTLRPFIQAHGWAPYTDEDYDRHLNGRPRLDGIRTVLESRGFDADSATVAALARDKNAAFLDILATQGSGTYPDAIALLDYTRAHGLKTAVVSSSANADAVLEAAGIHDRFDVIVSGITAHNAQLAGKPAPDPYLFAAHYLGFPPDQTLVIEDAAAGVASGHAAGATVVAIDRGAGIDALTGAGAHLVVNDLNTLIQEPADAR